MPSTLITEPNISDPDDFYSKLLELHEGRSTSDSHALNARLILVLCNHIGDREVLSAAFKLAAGGENEETGNASS